MRSILSVALAAISFNAMAQDEPTQSDFYTLIPFNLPETERFEPGGIELLPDGRVAVCTRTGEIWTVSNPETASESEPAKWTLYANYLHEPLGLAWKDGSLYATQRPEVTRITDEDGDGRADLFDSVSDRGWGINGNYHEYAFGSRFDKDDNIWVALCLTGSFTSNERFRGWILRVNQDGTITPTASGVRSPGGIGFNAEGDVFYCDNQGAWNGSSSLKWVDPGSFQGNPNGNIWYQMEGVTDAAGDRPVDPSYEETTHFAEEARVRIDNYLPPAVVLPHGKVGNSPTGIEPILNDNFGPFKGQLLVGEQTHSKINRVFLEKVNGVYQGAVFPFLEGFGSGNIPVRLAENGKLYTGGSNRGWGARGGQPYNFERVEWTGEVPFEVHEMRATSDGFELTFTKPVDLESARADASYNMTAYTYYYQKAYGSPEVGQVEPTVTVASVSDDGKSVRLKVTPLTNGHVHELSLEGITEAGANHGLLHPMAYYTLNEIPK